MVYIGILTLILLRQIGFIDPVNIERILGKDGKPAPGR